MKRGRRSRCSLRGTQTVTTYCCIFPFDLPVADTGFYSSLHEGMKAGHPSKLTTHSFSAFPYPLSILMFSYLGARNTLPHKGAAQKHLQKQDEERHWALYSHDWDLQDLREWKNLENVVIK